MPTEGNRRPGDVVLQLRSAPIATTPPGLSLSSPAAGVADEDSESPVIEAALLETRNSVRAAASSGAARADFDGGVGGGGRGGN